jgi:hypothetical protein
MKILKRFADEEVWNETTQEECLDRTEGSGYWKPGSVLSMLAEGHVIHTPFARYKAAQHSVQRTAEPFCQVCLMPLSQHVHECAIPSTRRR